AGWTPSNWAQSDWDNQIAIYNTIRTAAPDTYILLCSFMGFAGDARWGANYLASNGVSWSNAGFAYHGYESKVGIEANISYMKSSTSYPATLCTEFGIGETVGQGYNNMFESHYNGWMQFQWLGANDADLLDFKNKIESAGTIWRPDNTSCNWPTKGTLNIPTGTIGLFDRGQDMFVTATSANSDNLRAEAATYTASSNDAFVIEDLGTGLVALKRNSDNKYVRTTSETDSLTASQSSIGINEMFEFLRLDNDDIALRAYGGGGHLVKSSSAGTTLVPDGDSGSILDTKYVILTAPGGKPAPILSPYHGTPSVIPGTIEAEDFDLGGAGLAYSDTDPGNGPGQYRPTEDVDIENRTGGGYNIGYIAAGEWLAYTVDVEKTADYILDVSVAGLWSDKTFHVEFDGVDKTGSLTVPHVNWQAWRTVSVTVSLDAGIQIMKFVAETGEHNLDNFTLTRIGGDCDIDGDDKVDTVDFAIFAQNWQDTSCGTCG
ncbi:MAG: carbohydrate-binding protein, partial [Anaerohalosphaeraceae bacterium]